MDALKIVLALHAPGQRPDLAAGLTARGHEVLATHNQADTWNAARRRRPDAVLLVPAAREADSPELASLAGLAAVPGGPALLVITDRPALLEAHAEHVADFLAPDADLDEIARRLRFSVRRQRALGQIHRERDELLAETATDFKTGLANDRGFSERCRIEVARAARQGQPLGVLMIDLDEFKRINDEHDHPFGDYVLRRIGEILVHGLRPFDTPARKGGDEFAVLLPNTPLDHVATIADRLRRAVEDAPMEHGGHSTRATITVGAASWSPGDEEGFDDVLRGADQALLSAKRRGRNRVGVYAGPVPEDLELVDVAEAGADAETEVAAAADRDGDRDAGRDTERAGESASGSSAAAGAETETAPRRGTRRTRGTRSPK